MAGSTGMVWYDPGVVLGVQHLCFFRVCLAPLWLVQSGTQRLGPVQGYDWPDVPAAEWKGQGLLVPRN